MRLNKANGGVHSTQSKNGFGLESQLIATVFLFLGKENFARFHYLLLSPTEIT